MANRLQMLGQKKKHPIANGIGVFVEKKPKEQDLGSWISTGHGGEKENRKKKLLN